MNVCASILYAVGCLFAEDPGGLSDRQILWQRDLETALAIAAEERRPLLVAVNMDGESACERIVRELYREPAFVALTRRAVCVVASAFRHTLRDVDDRGRRVPCPRLGVVTCGEHVALEPILFDRYLGGERVAPRHALITPEGKKRFDLFLLFDLGEVERRLRAELAPWPEPVPLRPRPPRPFDTWRELLYRTDHRQTAVELLGVARAHGFEEEALGAVWSRLRDPEDPRGAMAPPPGLLTMLGELAEEDPAARRVLIAAAVLHAGTPAGEEARDALARVLAAGADVSSAIADQSVPAERLLGLAGWVRGRNLVEPARSSEVASEESLQAELSEAMGALERGDPDAELRVGRASLAIAKYRFDNGAPGGHIFLVDAERFLDRALDEDARDPALWLDRARAAYYRSRFDDQERFALEALRRLDRLPDLVTADTERLVDALRSELHHETWRWVGDAAARILSSSGDEESETDPVAEAERIARGARALMLAAAGPRADEVDFQSVQSFLGLVGLPRLQLKWLVEGVRRFPASAALRQDLNALLWRAGRPRRLTDYAERVLAESPSADSLWYLGYARMLVGDQLRREERPDDAIREYLLAEEAFERSAEEREDFRASCDYYRALSAMCRGFAHLLADRQAAAADCLLEAVRRDRSVLSARDGTGREMLDLVDGCLEWRARGRSPVEPMALLRRIETVYRDDAFFALAIADSALREALRAYGRGDLGMGDDFMLASIGAARRAREIADDEDTRRQFAQSHTVFAEHLLPRGQVDRARESICFAAEALGIEPPGPAASREEVERVAAMLREMLGEARPIARPGR